MKNKFLKAIQILKGDNSVYNQYLFVFDTIEEMEEETFLFDEVDDDLEIRSGFGQYYAIVTKLKIGYNDKWGVPEDYPYDYEDFILMIDDESGIPKSYQYYDTDFIFMVDDEFIEIDDIQSYIKDGFDIEILSGETVDYLEHVNNKYGVETSILKVDYVGEEYSIDAYNLNFDSNDDIEKDEYTEYYFIKYKGYLDTSENFIRFAEYGIKDRGVVVIELDKIQDGDILKYVRNKKLELIKK